MQLFLVGLSLPLRSLLIQKNVTLVKHSVVSTLVVTQCDPPPPPFEKSYLRPWYPFYNNNTVINDVLIVHRG